MCYLQIMSRFKHREYFMKFAEQHVTIFYLLPDSQIDKVQPIDAVIERMFKKKKENEMDKWLDDEENIEKWHDKISARQRRILMTK